MPIGGRLRLRSLAAVVAAAVVAQLGIFGATASAADTPLWKVEVAKIPTTKYTRDAKVYVTEATQALRPYVGDGLGASRIDPVLADVGTRYFDGARLKSADDGAIAFDNLQHLESFLKGRLNGASPPNGEAEQAHIAALVDSLTGVRLLADAAIQDAEATIGPFRASPPPAPAPAGLAAAFTDLDTAKVELAKTDDMLVKGNPEPASVHAAMAWAAGFNVLTRLGITYDGDHDGDGVVDVVELRFGASPLLADSDGDGLTDKTEITQLAGWTMPNNPDSDGDGVPDGEEDIDGDGLTNLQEQELGTSLTEADTDGDGLSDGGEVAKGTNPLVPDQPKPDPISGNTPPIVPAPTDVDTDGDGMGDSREGEVGTDPANVDTDGDGLSDGEEADVLMISPVSADTDGDGLGDGYEIEHAGDQGTDPAIPDERISKWTYVSDFLIGLTAGDFAQRDSMAWLAGNLCSAGLSFIPVVGWILGGLTDLRDAIAGLIHGDWISAGLSIIGLIPIAGDAAEIPGKVARFVLRYLHRFDEVIRMVARYDKISDSFKTLAIKAIMLGQYDNLTRIGLDDALILRLARGTRTSLKALNEAIAAANHVPSAIRSGFKRTAQEAEDWLGDTMRGATPPRTGIPTGPGAPKAKIPTPGNPSPNSYREPDFLEHTPNGDVIHEIKAGHPYWEESALKQCNQDAAMLAAGQVVGVFWHFVAHVNNSLGPTPALLDCLKGHNIPFTIYAP